MQKVDSLLNQAALSCSTQPSTQPSQTKPEQLKGILKELVTMGLLNNSGDPEMVRVWTEGLADIPYYALRAGLKKARDFVGYFNLPAFRELCRMTAEELGLPDVRMAYIESCMADQNHTWSHSAVYHAAKQTGAFELRTKTENEIFPLYRRNYEIICKRILAGEDLSLPTQKALPEKVFVPADENKARDSLSKLKSMLG